jgi:hypothetical protein
MDRWRNGILVACLVVAVLLFATSTTDRLEHTVASTSDAGRLERTATSSITSSIDQYGNAVITTTNRRFSYVEVYPSHDLENLSWILLLEEFRSERSPGIEGARASVTVDGWAGDFTNPQKKVWTIRSEGDVGQAYDNFYEVTRYGCCGSQGTQIWFSLIDGQKVFTSNIHLVKVFVPNTKADLTRYFAWHSNEASIVPVERATVKDLQGVLQYGSERRVSQRLLLRSGIDLYLSKVAFRYQGKLHDDRQALEQGLGLWGVNKATSKIALSDFSIVLTFNDQFEVEIPVEKDELQIAKAQVPAKLILETAK